MDMRSIWFPWLILVPLLLQSACSKPDDPADDQPPAPGVFEAGLAEVKIPAPLGSPAIGYGQIGADPSVTPFADLIPGTTRQHGALSFKAVALSRGDDHEVILVRADMLGIQSQLRSGVLLELEQRLGRNLNDSLIIGSNHTHGGPGRVVDRGGTFGYTFDTFDPELYTNVVSALADAVELALLDLAPAELGYTMAENSDAHNDRRCENDALLDHLQENPSLPIIAVKRDGRIDVTGRDRSDAK
jgi:hypothetical protein